MDTTAARFRAYYDEVVITTREREAWFPKGTHATIEGYRMCGVDLYERPLEYRIPHIRTCYAIVRLMNDAIENPEIREDVAEFFFQFYPFVLRRLGYAKLYLLPLLKLKYPLEYIFTRCTFSKEELLLKYNPKQWKDLLRRWDIRQADRHYVNGDSYYFGKNCYIEMFGKFKYKKHGMFVTTPTDEQVFLPKTLGISGEDIIKLNMQDTVSEGLELLNEVWHCLRFKDKAVEVKQ
jgi:hypothetical protein